MTDIEKLSSDIEYRNSGDIVADARTIIDSSQRAARGAVNAFLVLRNWFLGRRIVEEELGDATRSETYGHEIVINLSKQLNSEYGKGFDRSSLYRFAQFYKTFPDIVATASRQSSRLLTWSHYAELLRVDDPDARCWYEKEAFDQGWAVKTLRRNINTQYYHRLLMTADARRCFASSMEMACSRKISEFRDGLVRESHATTRLRFRPHDAHAYAGGLTSGMRARIRWRYGA